MLGISDTAKAIAQMRMIEGADEDAALATGTSDVVPNLDCQPYCQQSQREPERKHASTREEQANLHARGESQSTLFWLPRWSAISDNWDHPKSLDMKPIPLVL